MQGLHYFYLIGLFLVLWKHFGLLHKPHLDFCGMAVRADEGAHGVQLGELFISSLHSFTFILKPKKSCLVIIVGFGAGEKR